MRGVGRLHVKMERAPASPAEPLRRLKDLPSNFLGINWYSDYPDHYADDARVATRDKGLALRAILVETLAEFIAAVNKEFFERTRAVSQPLPHP